MLDKDYFYFVEKTFLQNKEMVGVNGLIVNLSKQNFFKRLLFKLTHFGLFSDDRQSTIRFLKSNDLKFKRVNTLSGGISTWKKEVFEVVFFDKLMLMKTKNFLLEWRRSFLIQCLFYLMLNFFIITLKVIVKQF